MKANAAHIRGAAAAGRSSPAPPHNDDGPSPLAFHPRAMVALAARTAGGFPTAAASATVRGAPAAICVTGAAVAATGDAAAGVAVVSLGDNDVPGTSVVAAGAGSVGNEAETLGALPDAERIGVGDKEFRREAASAAPDPPLRCPGGVPGSPAAAGAGRAACEDRPPAGRERGSRCLEMVSESAEAAPVPPVSAPAIPAPGTTPRPRATIHAPTASHR